MIDARRTILPDIHQIAADMRPEDIAEAQAALGEAPHKALFRGYIVSTECYTVFHEQSRKPLAMFAYQITEPKVSATVWLLAANGLLDHRMEFARKSRAWVSYFQTKAPLLYNMVDQRNILHIRWLDWVGFKFVRVIPEWGKGRLPFVEFARTGNG